MPDSPDTIFHLARELPPADQGAYLDKACAGDTGMRARMEERLHGAAEVDAFFGADATTIEKPRQPLEEAGTCIGNYKLLQQIGEGGFGTVWMAEQQQPVQRRVALKIIKAGMDTHEVVARFEQERQALAMMDHPNIARVFDAGATATGRPYFVMELVKGIPITKFCDEAKLGTRERLLLFAEVCAAINHAHQKGVIHRDIKPSNVMVTLHGDKAMPKVIDFGIAKATQARLTDKTLFTRFEQFVGTPVYMSPEQAALSGLDIDTRSDIYALGVLLYELLTGTPPFDTQTLVSAGYDEMRRIIREIEPPKPSSRLSTVSGEERTALAVARHISPYKLNRMVAPDLDWIVMKAIEKDRTRRYETANAFALDIRHFLDDEPVSASPPGAGYLLRKFARRHRGALRVAVAITLLLVAATVVSTLLAIRARRAEQQAKQQRDEKIAALTESETIARFLTEILQSPNPAVNSRSITVEEALGGATGRIESSLAGQPAIQARLRTTLGETWHALGQAAMAVPLQQKALEFYLACCGPEHPDTLRARGALAWSLYDLNDKRQGIKMQQEVLEVSRRVLGEKHPDTITARGRLAVSIFFDGRKKEGLKMLEESLALSREAFGHESTATLPLMHWLAVAYRDDGQEDRANAMNETVLPLMQKAYGPKHPDSIRALSAVAGSRQGTEALDLHRQVLDLAKEVFGPVHPVTLAYMATLASALRHNHLPKDALQLLEQTSELMKNVGQEDSPDSLWVMTDLAGAYEQNGQKEAALALRKKVLDLTIKKNTADSDLVIVPTIWLAKALADNGRIDEAIALQEKAVPRMKKSRGEDHSDTIWAMEELAGFYSKKGRKEDALTLRRGILTLLVGKHTEEHPATIGAMARLAAALADSNHLDEAIPTQEKALALSRDLTPATPDATRWIMDDLAGYYKIAGRHDEARKISEERAAMKNSRPK